MEQEESGALALLNTGFQHHLTCYSSVLISLGALAISYLVMQAYITASANVFFRLRYLQDWRGSKQWTRKTSKSCLPRLNLSDQQAPTRTFLPDANIERHPAQDPCVSHILLNTVEDKMSAQLQIKPPQILDISHIDTGISFS